MNHNDIQTSEGPTQQEKRRGKKTLSSFASIGDDFWASFYSENWFIKPAFSVETPVKIK